MKRRTLLGSAAALTLANAAQAGTAQAGPALSGARPNTRVLPGTPVLPLGPFNPAAAQYSVAEYIVSGTATSYQQIGTADAQGHWQVKQAGSAAYTTRIVVIRPKDAKKFNGSVLVEWLNVSGGLEVGPVWSIARRELLRSGCAYVAVSAQKVGIEGGTTVFGMPGKGLKQVDPQRYGSLHHPGDAYAFDIFSQAGALLKNHGASAILGNLPVRNIIAIGESQSASYLTTYVNAVDPQTPVYDGFLIYSRFGGGAHLDGSGMFGPGPIEFMKLTDALRVPTLVLETETDLLGPAGFYSARQPDTARLRIWELAGAAHADAYLVSVAAVDSGSASYATLATAWKTGNTLLGGSLAKPFNNGPQNHFVAQAAIAHLRQWVTAGTAPPHAPPIAMVAAGLPFFPGFPLLDANGNAQGGIRTPWVDVPISILAGYGNAGSPQAFIFGSAAPFDAAKLASLYPGGKPEYLRRFEASLHKTIAKGFILPADRAEILGVAALSYGI